MLVKFPSSQSTIMSSRIPKDHGRDRDYRSSSPSPSGDTDESFHQVIHSTSRTNHDNLGSFGDIRHGFTNPSQHDRRGYPYPLRLTRGPRDTFGEAHTASLMDLHSAGGHRSWRRSIPAQEAFDMEFGLRIEGEDIDHPMMFPHPSSTAIEKGGPRWTTGGNFDMFPMMQDSSHPSNSSHITYVPMNSYELPLRFSQTPDPQGSSSPLPGNFGRRTKHKRPSVRSPTTSPIPPLDRSSYLSKPSLMPFSPPKPRPYTITSSSTIQPSLSLNQQRMSHFNTLYNTCLEASTFYLSTLRTRHHLTSGHYEPYSPPRNQRARYASLMENISAICTHIWRKARSHNFAPHRAEAEATRIMRDLYGLGEVLTRGFNSEGLLVEQEVDMDIGESVTSAWTDLGDYHAIRVGEAAKSLCSCLRDRRAWSECDDVLKMLRDLEGGEAGSETLYENV